MIVIDLISENPNRKFAPYERMANAIIELTRKNGDCQSQDLLAQGFTKQEVLDLWHMANAMAQVEIKLMKNENDLSHRPEKRCASSR